MDTSSRPSDMRELDARSRDGIRVRLLWQPSTDSLFVEVADEDTGDQFQIRVGADEALDALDDVEPCGSGGGAESPAWRWE
jgi:hypothetical protein